MAGPPRRTAPTRGDSVSSEREATVSLGGGLGWACLCANCCWRLTGRRHPGAGALTRCMLVGPVVLSVSACSALWHDGTISNLRMLQEPAP